MSDRLDRREMLRVSAAAAVSLAVARSLRGKEPPLLTGCTLGFSTYGMKTLKTEQALRAIAEIGYDSAEITLNSGWDADSAILEATRRTELRKLLTDLPLRVASLMEHLTPTDDRLQANALDRLKLAAGVAHDLVPDAPPLIQTVLGGGKFEEIKNPLRDRLAEWVKIADETETIIAIKPHRGGAVSQPAEAAWLLEQLGNPKRLRMVYDYSHYAFRDLPLAETVRTALPYTAHIAVKDAVQEGERVVFQLPGTAGTIDFPELLRLFYAGGYRGDVNCEVSGMVWNQQDYEPLAAAKTCYANMAAAFEKAQVPRRSAK